MRTLGKLVALLLLIGFVGAHWLPIALTIGAGVISNHVGNYLLTFNRS